MQVTPVLTRDLSLRLLPLWQVEYLKAQLASEQQYKAELEANVASMKDKINKVRDGAASALERP